MNATAFRAPRACSHSVSGLPTPALRPSLLALAAAAFPLLAAAQDEARATQVDEIIVIANPLGRTADEVIQPVNVLSGEELARKLRGTLGETLENQPGVSTTDFGLGAGRPVIRGLAGPRVEILDNGLSTMDVSDLSPDHAVSIDPSHARQIEILKGPSTLLYGNAASGGAVNVVDDRMPDEVKPGLHGVLEGLYGSNGDLRQTHTELDYGTGAHQLHADFSWRETNDYDIPGAAHADGDGARGTLPNSATRSGSGAVSYNHFSGRNVYGFSYSRYDSRYGLPFAHGHHEEEEGEEEEAHEDETPTGFIDLRQNRYDTRILLDRPLSGLESLKLRAGYSDYTHTEFEAPGEVGTRFDNEQIQARIEAVHVPVGGFRGVVGVQFNDRDFSALGEEAYVPPVKSRSLGLFAVEEYELGIGRLEFGARVERNSNDPQDNPKRDFTPVSLSFGSIFDLGEHAHVKLYLTRSERSPVQEELYAFGPHAATATFERGNVDLRKERFDNVELGFDHHLGRFYFEASAFYNRASNYIYLAEVDEGLDADGSGVPVSDGEADRVNDEGEFDAEGEFLLVDYRQADARLYGYEIEAGYTLLADGPLKLRLGLFTDSVRARLDRDGNLPRITPMRYGLSLTAAADRASASLRYTRVQEQDRIAALETPTEGYDLLNADLNLRVWGVAEASSGLQVFVRGTNLLDEEIRRSTSFIKDLVPAPGRSGQIGLRFDF